MSDQGARSFLDIVPVNTIPAPCKDKSRNNENNNRSHRPAPLPCSSIYVFRENITKIRHLLKGNPPTKKVRTEVEFSR